MKQQQIQMKFILIAWRKCPERVKSSDEAIYPKCFVRVRIQRSKRKQNECYTWCDAMWNMKKTDSHTHTGSERIKNGIILTWTAVDRLMKIKNYHINVSSINKLERHICGARMSFTYVYKFIGCYTFCISSAVAIWHRRNMLNSQYSDVCR